MNIPYLIKILDTKKLSELVANIDTAPIDMNLAIWDSIDRGEIEVDAENDCVKLLGKVEPSSDPDLKHKILRVIQHYARQQTNINRGRLSTYIKDPVSGKGYGWHDYLTAVQHLIDGELITEMVIDVSEAKQTIVGKKGKKKEVVARPAHKFAFLCLVENAGQNAEWNKKAVNKWVADMEQLKVK